MSDAAAQCPGAPETPPARAALLLVEDDAPLRQMLSLDLADLGYDIAAAAGCTEARALVAQQSFRFALIDVHLPDGDGRDLAAELTGRLPELRIVLMSGDERARAASPPPCGVLAFLAKPVDLDSAHRVFTAASSIL